MASNKDNLIFEKTSFLHGNNSPFIRDLYSKYLSNPESVPESWIKFFDGLNENEEIVKKEVLGPSWAPQKKNNIKINYPREDSHEDKDLSILNIAP